MALDWKPLKGEEEPTTLRIEPNPVAKLALTLTRFPAFPKVALIRTKIGERIVSILPRRGHEGLIMTLIDSENHTVHDQEGLHCQGVVYWGLRGTQTTRKSSPISGEPEVQFATELSENGREISMWQVSGEELEIAIGLNHRAKDYLPTEVKKLIE
jgi:hypothetical protein